MARPLNKIGGFTFVALKGDPTSLREELQIVRRPGTDGLGFWKTGVRGQPFRLISEVDAPTFAGARSLYRQYKALIGADPVYLIWASLNITVGEGVLVVVQDVRPLSVARIGAAVGTLNSNPGGWIVAEWTLVPVSV